MLVIYMITILAKRGGHLAHACVAAVSLMLLACGSDFKGMDAMSSCNEAVEKQVASPGGEYLATLFERNCGATTGYVTHINLRLASDADRPDTHGVINDGQVLVANGQMPIEIRWIDGTNLVINVRAEDRHKIVSVRETWKTAKIKVEEQTS
jgi:hypothetical protein